MRVRLVWVLLFSFVSHKAVVANDNPTTSTSRASGRDQDAVIQKIRGLRNEGMKLNDAHNFRGAIEKLRDALAALHEPRLWRSTSCNHRCCRDFTGRCSLRSNSKRLWLGLNSCETIRRSD